MSDLRGRANALFDKMLDEEMPDWMLIAACRLTKASTKNPKQYLERARMYADFVNELVQLIEEFEVPSE